MCFRALVDVAAAVVVVAVVVVGLVCVGGLGVSWITPLCPKEGLC